MECQFVCMMHVQKGSKCYEKFTKELIKINESKGRHMKIKRRKTMRTKKGLGKGLGALFNDNDIIDDDDNKVEIKDGEEVVHKIKIIEIEPNKNQPRRNFNNESIEELAESIKRYGVIQPIIVTKKDNYYEIVAGERRWRASKKAGLEEIPLYSKRRYREKK